jgi:hypothetical protein
MYLKERKGGKAYNKKAQDIIELLLYAAQLKDTLPKESVGIKKQKAWPKELEVSTDMQGHDSSKEKILRLSQQLADHTAMIQEQRDEINDLKEKLSVSNEAIESILEWMGTQDNIVAENHTSSPVNNSPPLVFDTTTNSINSTVIARLGSEHMGDPREDSNEDTLEETVGEQITQNHNRIISEGL